MNNDTLEKIYQYRKAYFMRDENLLIDSSMLGVKAFPFIIYEHIYFGNKILIPDFCIRDMEIEANDETVNRNMEILKGQITRDERGNYRIVQISYPKSSRREQIINFLSNNRRVILLTCKPIMQNECQERNLRYKRYYANSMELNTYGLPLHTIGAIQFNKRDMYICNREGRTRIFVYDRNLNLKGYARKVLVDLYDYIFFITDKKEVYTILIYQIVNCHSRHHAFKECWTDIKKENAQFTFIKDNKFRGIVQKLIEEC